MLLRFIAQNLRIPDPASSTEGRFTQWYMEGLTREESARLPMDQADQGNGSREQDFPPLSIPRKASVEEPMPAVESGDVARKRLGASRRYSDGRAAKKKRLPAFLMVSAIPVAFGAAGVAAYFYDPALIPMVQEKIQALVGGSGGQVPPAHVLAPKVAPDIAYKKPDTPHLPMEKAPVGVKPVSPTSSVVSAMLPKAKMLLPPLNVPTPDLGNPAMETTLPPGAKILATTRSVANPPAVAPQKPVTGSSLPERAAVPAADAQKPIAKSSGGSGQAIYKTAPVPVQAPVYHPVYHPVWHPAPPPVVAPPHVVRHAPGRAREAIDSVF